ncbi:MAG: bifunctional tRNA (5-methylaminomethyl-2-thiouridine)(34)-methyltransferase MnmD/FAD-dependent 5-carboxymethylaminomethyl-2-thiouridine(34) oxidoreductase MnmC [Methylocystaceae bacterium]|nr:bifunctional tRNA (5-methylaminomethyl-2-thiouridine)(34)-methyltransferase MnmD/FAD-dependent 5-carboxymethylaminomethyl-2-thiouridine(34) oxidoreductase MnmC [Methylocystaceae bacterium]
MSELESPELEWKDAKTPVSARFDDVYFSADDGLAESQYVFLDGCGVSESFDGKDHVTIAETGFGTGLNFLLTLKAWQETQTDCIMHYISVEGFPLTKDQLRSAYKNFPGLDVFTEELLSVYPTLTPGFHHLVLQGGRVKLTLLLGEAVDMLSDLDCQVDAWYLDGFAPQKNPEMWRTEVFEQMARLSRTGTVLSTFTAAGFVKRGLDDAGFTMVKRKGFGRKRECLQGVFEAEETITKTLWYARTYDISKRKKIAVIGAGVAGLHAAYRLQADGHDVTVFERNAQAGMEGSGNRIGLIKPKLFLNQEGPARFNTIAYLHALQFYDGFDDTPWHGDRGLFQVAKNEKDEDHMKELAAREILPSDDLIYLSAQQASKRLSLNVERGGLWYPRSGCVEPAPLCRIIAGLLDVEYESKITKIEKQDEGWRVYQGDNVLFTGDCVVLATAGENTALNEYCDLPMQGRRGQVSYVKAHAHSQSLAHAVSYGGYLLPAKDGEHIVGASFEYWPDFFDHSFEDVTDESHIHNLNILQGLMDTQNLEVTGGRASIRAMTGDHHPMVGPIFSKDWYREEYHRLKHGPRAKKFARAEYIDGLFTICGLGARGVQTAPLLADILSSYIAGTPCPVENTIREALHPARFLIRDIIKGKL